MPLKPIRLELAANPEGNDDRKKHKREGGENVKYPTDDALFDAHEPVTVSRWPGYVID
jgi:hypothetical protein